MPALSINWWDFIFASAGRSLVIGIKSFDKYIIVKNSVAEIIINEPLKPDFHPHMIEIFGINDEALHGIFNVYKCDTMKLYLRTPGARNGNFTGGYISFLVKRQPKF